MSVARPGRQHIADPANTRHSPSYLRPQQEGTRKDPGPSIPHEHPWRARDFLHTPRPCRSPIQKSPRPQGAHASTCMSTIDGIRRKGTSAPAHRKNWAPAARVDTYAGTHDGGPANGPVQRRRCVSNSGHSRPTKHRTRPGVRIATAISAALTTWGRHQ